MKLPVYGNHAIEIADNDLYVKSFNAEEYDDNDGRGTEVTVVYRVPYKLKLVGEDKPVIVALG